ncbi:MAG: peptidylprolyl isomerase [Candidatus Micrarchaeota archaeon]|nr:peptidylprolyl isomerase [Candidatus Micrarchaeota archaeon]
MATLLLGFGCISLPSSQNLPVTTEVMRSDVLSGAQTALRGDIVHVDYIGMFENGTVFDTSIASEAQKAGLPQKRYEQLVFRIGDGQIIKGFEDAVVGMREGEVKTVKIEPKDAYGEWDPRLVATLPIDNFENAEDIKVGGFVYSASGAPGIVTAIQDGKVTVDFNHELAGKTLVYTIKLVRVDKR